MEGKVRTQRMCRDDWQIIIPNSHVGYFTWAEYEENLKQLKQNAQARGIDKRNSPPREGCSLLQGIVICGYCGKRMTVRYVIKNEKLTPRYLC